VKQYIWCAYYSAFWKWVKMRKITYSNIMTQFSTS
jgi:hypothetical protein